METENKKPAKKKEYYSIVRILQTDIPGNKQVLVGLGHIKGISWMISNAICKKLNLPQNKKIAELSEEEIKTITEFIKSLELPEYLYNRRNDLETGKDLHLTGNDLNIKHEFDIRKLKKVRSYRGLRHALKLPTRGQKTRSNFRKGKKKPGGIKKKKWNEN